MTTNGSLTVNQTNKVIDTEPAKYVQIAGALHTMKINAVSVSITALNNSINILNVVILKSSPYIPTLFSKGLICKLFNNKLAKLKPIIAVLENSIYSF